MFHLLKIRTSIDVFSTEKCKVTFGLKYIPVIVFQDFTNTNFQSPNLQRDII